MFLVLLALVGCMTPEAFTTEYAAARCDYAERCGKSWEDAAEVYGVTTCQELQALAIGELTLVSDWDAAAAAACIEWTRETQDCDGLDYDEDPCPAMFEE